MTKNLVIVESPSKSKTIEKYLGKDYHVVSSKGHIRDLSTKGKYGLGVDVDNNFKPDYTFISGKKKLIKELNNMKTKITIVDCANFDNKINIIIYDDHLTTQESVYSAVESHEGLSHIVFP